MFSLREGLNLEMSKLSRIRSSKLEEEWQDEIMEKPLGEMSTCDEYGGCVPWCYGLPY